MHHASPRYTFRNILPQTWTQGRASGHPGWSRVSLGTSVLLRVSESVQVGVGPASGPTSSEPGVPSILGRRWAVHPNLICVLQWLQQRATGWCGQSPQAGGPEPRVRAEPAGQWPSASAATGESLEVNSPIWDRPSASLNPKAVLQLLCTRTASLAPVTNRHPSGVGIHPKWSMLWPHG